MTELLNFYDKVSLCNHSYKAVLASNKMVKNVANLGLKKFMRATIERGGEYVGFTIEVQEDVDYLITDYRIKTAIKFISKNDYDSSARELNIHPYYLKYGDNIVLLGLKLWFEANKIDIPNILLNLDDIGKNEIAPTILRHRHCCINKKLIIISSGINNKTNNPVVPLEWIGREFDNGDILHEEMNKLPWRAGKPPVTFCCIYSMIVCNNKIQNDKAFHTNETVLLVIDKNVHVNIYPITKQTLDNINSYSNYIHLKLASILIAIDKCLINTSKNFTRTENVGYLSSLLQKCLRRGNYNTSLLVSTINKLYDSPPYNLPEQKFIRVSGQRQLFWRSFISIVEEISGYDTTDLYDLLDIFGLAIVCQVDPDIRFKRVVINKLIGTLLSLQSAIHIWDWRQGNSTDVSNELDYKDHRIEDSLKLAYFNMPMMQGDRKMITKTINLIKNDYVFPKINKLQNIPQSDYLIEKETKLVAMDMHCYPNILIRLQGSIPWIPKSNEELSDMSKFIWEYNSKYNFRLNTLQHYDKMINTKRKILLDIQNYLINKPQSVITKSIIKSDIVIVKNDDDMNISQRIKRLSFILIFGRKIKIPHYEITITGTNDKPCRVKKPSIKNTIYVDNEERDRVERKCFDLMNKGIEIILPPPPEYYRWTIPSKVIISTKTINNKTKFYVNNIEVDLFDGSKVIEKIKYNDKYTLSDRLEELIKETLYYDYSLNVHNDLLELLEIANMRRYLHDYKVYDWKKYGEKIPYKVWIQIYARIKMAHMTEKNSYEIYIGPIDRGGNKTHNSISYRYEGVIWRIMIVLSALFPNVIIHKSDNIFQFNKNEQYLDLINDLNEIIKPKTNNVVYNFDPKINTKLWDHQLLTGNKIVEGFANGIRGYGDASCVGAGKTLTALFVIQKLYERNKNNNDTNYSGYVIMLPTDKLYDTWKDEINKHTTGFEIIFQTSQGKIDNTIKSNSIVITTMGRMREHPIIHSWTLVIIDECLTVQNKDALQTEEAWRQSLISQYGVLMMSATFFRSRFDKLLYMLKMLQTGIPENQIYLDTLLTEHMVCNIKENDRVWTTNISRIEMNKKTKKIYDETLRKSNGSSYEKIYNNLLKVINDNIDYVDLIMNEIKMIEKENPKNKILIYAKSKEEADNIALRMEDNVWRFGQEKSNKRHTVLSYAEGTFGLNSLTNHNVILTRPVEPDRIVQMKGRLDRMGQQEKILNIRYILIKDTIEEAGIYRLELANHFHKNYIMPLAEFYKIAIEKKFVYECASANP